jgi:hypothetical protein
MECTTCKKIKSETKFNYIRGKEYTKKRYTHCEDCTKIKKVCGASSKKMHGCGQELSIDHYSNLTSGSHGKFPICTDCRGKFRREKPKKARPEKGTEVKCNSCKETLDESKFDADGNTKNGLQLSCKECRKDIVNKSCSTYDCHITRKWNDLLSNAKKEIYL